MVPSIYHYLYYTTLLGQTEVFIDISMHHIDIIEIQNKISIFKIKKKFEQ